MEVDLHCEMSFQSHGIVHNGIFISFDILGAYYHEATQVTSLQNFSWFSSWASGALGTVVATVYCVFYLYLSANLCI